MNKAWVHKADLVIAIVSGWSCDGFLAGGHPSTEEEKFSTTNINDNEGLVKIA